MVRPTLIIMSKVLNWPIRDFIAIALVQGQGHLIGTTLGKVHFPLQAQNPLNLL